MTTQAQIEANRRNAQKSTGPKTDEGKAASSRNALKHGLTAQQLILFDETAEDFAAFLAELRQDHAPADATEAVLVERIAVAHWRLRRVWRAEAALFNNAARAAMRNQTREAMRHAIAEGLEAHPPEGKKLDPDEVQRLARAGVRALSEAALDDAAQKAIEAGEEAPPSLAELGLWPAGLAELQRHEASLERTLHRLTIDLDRMQRRRHQRIMDQQAAARAQLEADGRMLAIRRKVEAEMKEQDLAALESAKRTQSPPNSLAPPGRGRGEGAPQPSSPSPTSPSPNPLPGGARASTNGGAQQAGLVSGSISSRRALMT